MAKKKVAGEDSDEKDVKGNGSLASIMKKYGEIMIAGTGLIEKPPHVFPVSPAIDFVLSGGIPEGSFVGMSGPPGCGKSTTALQLIANAQKPQHNYWSELDYDEDGNKIGAGKPRKIFYADVEHRLKKMNMLGIVGLDPDRVEVIKSIKGHILSAQDFLDIIEAIVKDEVNEGCVIVVDSASALCPADELVAGTSGQIRSTTPKIMAHWCRKMAAPVKVMSATIVLIQHVIANTSGFGSPWSVDGGEKVKFQFDVNMTTRNQPEKWEEDDQIVGHIVTWKIIKSALGASGNTTESCLRFGKGLDAVKEIFRLAVELAIIDKSGAWFSFDMNGTAIKAQGDNKMCAVLANNPEALEFIRKQVYSYMGV